MVIEKNTNNCMDVVYRDILAISFDINDTFKSITDKFYKVMRKNKICQGTWTETGSRQVANPEWCAAYLIFETHVMTSWKWQLLLNDPPKDLLAYGTKPSKKRKYANK